MDPPSRKEKPKIKEPVSRIEKAKQKSAQQELKQRQRAEVSVGRARVPVVCWRWCWNRESRERYRGAPPASSQKQGSPRCPEEISEDQMVRRQTRVTCQVSGTPPPPRPVPGGLLMTPGAELLWQSPEWRKKGEREGLCEGGSCKGVQEQVSHTLAQMSWIWPGE